jgi:hypothetical protein
VTSRVAALAIRNVDFHANRVFDREAIEHMRATLHPMALPWLAVHAEATRRGVRLLTADSVGAEGISPRHLRLIAYDWTPWAEALLAGGAQPSVLVSLEPPVIAWWLYANLPKVSARFRHVFLFEGARSRVARGTTFHQLAFPLCCPSPHPSAVAWPERRFLVLVSSNKVLPSVLDPRRWLDRPREVSLKRALAALLYPAIAADRYRERLAAMEAFADRPDFDVFGEGWDRRHPAVSPRQHARLLRAVRGPAPDKLALLGRYRFVLAIENTRFRGYVSEKLFDAFYAGAIPVYDGAPDVLRYVPPETFIDRRTFASYAELEGFLRALSEREAQRYLDAAQAFLRSAAFARFCADRFAADLLDTLLTDAEG